MATQVNVGQALQQSKSQQKSEEIQEFLRNEMFSFRHATQRHPISHSTKNVSKVVSVGNGRIECR